MSLTKIKSKLFAGLGYYIHWNIQKSLMSFEYAKLLKHNIFLGLAHLERRQNI